MNSLILGQKTYSWNSRRLGEFWCSLRENYPHLAKRAMKDFIPFATIYPSKLGFSTLVTNKKSKSIGCPT
jgi:hypothetical protein